MAVIRADLHAHTTASDGMDSPAELVARAAARGLDAIAVTDHDTMDGVEEAKLQGERSGVIVIAGVELSTARGGKDIHVLGYGPDRSDPLWLERLSAQGKVRERRNELLLRRLGQLGIDLTLGQVLDAAALGGGGVPASLGRPHFAAALVKAGAVSTVREAFELYLAEGAPAYVEIPRITPEEGIRWIVEAGGTAVLAHPGLYHDDAEVERLASAGGLAGIEAFHSDHTPEEELKYARLAERHGLLATGGSDYHGSRGGEIRHGDLGSRTVDARALMERMKG
ncbi:MULTISPECIES: PHP domain-containing protein [unclassified Paenibacillus]|uniref:PHP domain-containing protein n=1 Tax=unclassified Paenibacillus TaxID=185978 RepID=UPI00095673E4|nr:MULTISPECIES: PHP domain-containing protein [unclassified Paenibacillus]ASS65843.1 PHP domain-containing protein [Paenibacillus sp. RUD330]SIQ21745.1 hypothetical protein SAMN05880555_1045 [Paenibacillus sp. RU4X]SIQ43492.1 hypothetical protein SAMN05880570_1044 [Paenibacillus sp. RU4T]